MGRVFTRANVGAPLGRWGTHEFVEPHVRRIVAESLGVSAADLVPGVSFRDDLAADSLDLTEVAIALEGEFGITLPERALDEVRFYRDLVEVTIAHIQRASATAGDAPPVRARTRLRPSEGEPVGTLEREVWLTPYEIETIVQEAARAPHPMALDVTVAPDTDDASVLWVLERLGGLSARGVRVSVQRDGRSLA